ncbi:Gfo/Idh/MocA family protein, partial [Acrocarpospora catenulata]|uniref:Gfo/Idh/MocA family protein n=1 Tax=Acrocarpospora catenulata TaxID=2836182 RepID=UPI001BDAFB03
MTAAPVRRRVAVLGCGGAALGIHLPALATHPDWQVVAVADRDHERAQHAAARFGVGRVARDTASLFEGADLLAVLTGVHEPWIEQALAAGMHVFTEKPVSLDVERTRRLRRQAAQAGVLLEVGVIRAFDPAVEALLRQVPAAGLRGGWLVKADGCDATARQAFLPPGAAPYTFADDPPQQAPAGLNPAGR